jgi:hypothetical protein
MQLRIGASSRPDAAEAVAHAAQAALAECRSPAFALVFSTFDYPPDDVAAALGQALGSLPWAGSVTPAILHGRCVLRRGVAVGVIDSDDVQVRVGAGGPLSTGARAAGRSAALDALTDMPLPPADRSRAMILFTDITCGDAAEVLRGAVSVAGAGVAWSGGGTGDGAGGARAAVFARGCALRDHVVAIALDGHARVGAGVQHGWQPIGAPAMVTQATGSVVARLEHRAAFEIYRAAAADRGEEIDAERFAAFATMHPLGIPQADGEYLIRDPLSVDADGAIHLVAGVPDGALVRVMDGTPAMLTAAARVAARMARDDVDGALGGAFVFDCVSRFVILGERLADELAACQDALGDHVPLLGCLTSGEVGAFGARMPLFHNKTMVVLALPGGT